ncbi:helix-turn-helix domain-containing protein [Gracilibacillus phocaeensis]|uniref:helix-turn-helix domain-containing protein n=1 Tax=Gracilibacillus phocaeensis TaxID=2042304 RepID=UPI001031628D|nr:helix-turn-helix transcriptional regulator [Gracilibacillus phocaeensis]
MFKFNERLRYIREETGFEQKEVGKRLNMTKSGYNHYESGRNQPSIETIIKIADILEISTDYLLGRIDTPYLPGNYTINDDLSLNEAEMLVVKEMKKSLMDKISDQPVDKVKRLEEYWDFIESKHE